MSWKALGAAVATLAIAACSVGEAAVGRETREAGPPTQRSYQVAAFDQIAVAGPYAVKVSTGGSPSVVAKGGEAILADLVVEVVDGQLRIHPTDRRGPGIRWTGNSKVELEVSAPALRKAAMAGSGGIEVDRVSGDSFEADIAGSGGIRVGEVAVTNAKLAIAGSGSIMARGRARSVDYGIAGSGDINAGELLAETAEASIAGSGNVNAHATGTAKVSVLGSGNINLAGGARCDVTRAGSGRVNCS